MEFQKQVEFLTKKGGQGHGDLGENFTVSQSQKTAGQLQALENAVDIKVITFIYCQHELFRKQFFFLSGQLVYFFI